MILPQRIIKRLIVEGVLEPVTGDVIANMVHLESCRNGKYLIVADCDDSVIQSLPQTFANVLANANDTDRIIEAYVEYAFVEW